MFSLALDQSLRLFILSLIPFGLILMVLILVIFKLFKFKITRNVIYISSICTLLVFFMVVMLAKKKADERPPALIEDLTIETEEESEEIETDSYDEEELRRIVEEAIEIKDNK